MVYPKNFENKIDFTTIREMLEHKCLSPLGVKCCKAMRFCNDFNIIEKLLLQTNEFLGIITAGKEFPINNYYDLSEQLENIKIQGAYMVAEELFNLQRSLQTIVDISSFFNKNNEDNSDTILYPELSELCSTIITPAVYQIIEQIKKILDKFGNIKDNASPKLAELKRSLAAATQNVNVLMRKIMSKGKEEGFIDNDVSPSIRDGRLVIPVSPMHKRKIKGIIHDESATGKTIYIEPEQVVEANNNIRELENEIHREIIRILVDIASFIRPHIEDLAHSFNILGKIDFIRAKALFAEETGGRMPILEHEPQVEYYHAIHPTLLLSLRAQGKKVIPLDIHLDDKNRILVISGPNAGGKSVCLKTVSIVQYMTQCGLLPPVYENSHIGIFKNLFIDIGDEQSIENDLSTYSSHLTNMKFFMNNGGRNSFILIDEFGGGTEPQIGGAIAQSILKQFNEKKIFGVITTHYQNLKHFAEDTPGLINGAMLYDRQEMKPLFQLSIGYPGSSFAVEIARKIGIPSEVIKDAENIVGSDYINMDKYLLDIARDKKYWEKKRADIHAREKKLQNLIDKYEQDIEELSGEKRNILKAAKEEAKNILDKSNAAIERTISEIKKTQAEKEQTKELRRQLDEFKSKLEKEDEEAQIKINGKKLKTNKKAKRAISENQSIEPITIGDYVTIDNGNTPCQVIELSQDTAVVAMGNFHSRINVKRLKKTVKQSIPIHTSSTTISMATSEDIRKRQLSFKPDIDVRGMRADEAIQAVTYFLDDAIQFNSKQIRILHGTGNGILRQRIREYLNTVGGVKSYRDEHVQFGGAGITVVDLE